MYDCLHEAMDLPGLIKMLTGVESGAIRTHFVESTEPSVLSHEILNGKPYTFLDDAPLEERRTRRPCSCVGVFRLSHGHWVGSTPPPLHTCRPGRAATRAP